MRPLTLLASLLLVALVSCARSRPVATPERVTAPPRADPFHEVCELYGAYAKDEPPAAAMSRAAAEVFEARGRSEALQVLGLVDRVSPLDLSEIFSASAEEAGHVWECPAWESATSAMRAELDAAEAAAWKRLPECFCPAFEKVQLAPQMACYRILEALRACDPSGGLEARLMDQQGDMTLKPQLEAAAREAEIALSCPALEAWGANGECR